MSGGRQESKFKEAIRYYAPIVEDYRKQGNLLDVTAIILANLCVAYIMTSQNDKAEALMRQIEAAERALAEERSDKPSFHLCIVNLVIGTLYCSKGNYEFGISRVMKSLEPYERKLGTDTWYYAKRCFLGLAEALAKHMVVLKDSTFVMILRVLDAVEKHGREILTVIPQIEDAEDAPPKRVVSQEARLVKRMYLRIREGLV